MVTSESRASINGGRPRRTDLVDSETCAVRWATRSREDNKDVFRKAEVSGESRQVNRLLWGTT